MVRFFGNALFFFAPLLLFAAGGAMIAYHHILGPLNTASLDRSALITVLYLRDFRTLPAETLADLTDRCEQEFGRNAVHKPVFQFSSTEKKVYAYFRAQKPRPKSCLEGNLTLMAKSRYYQWMQDYEQATPEQKIILMREVVLEMKYVEELYMDFLRAAQLPIPPLAELLQEFEQMIDAFKTGATPDEVARIDAFKWEMNRALAANEVHGALQKATNTLRNGLSETFGPLLPKTQHNKQ